MIVSGRRVVTPSGVLADHQVVVSGGVVERVEPATGRADFDIVAPGFIDMQVNGHDDIDVATMTSSQWNRMDTLLLSQGVTSWCPTLITAGYDHYAERMAHLDDYARAKSGGPTLCGVHLEGPFLGERHGAHVGVSDGPIDLEWLADLPSNVSVVTLGPERPNAVEAIALLVRRGVMVSLGHTAATFDQTRAAIEAGARSFTHSFNAVSSLHHREPGPLAAAFGDDRVYTGVIVDGVHVHPAMVDLLRRVKPADRVVFVTDAAAWRAGRLAGRHIEVSDGAPRLPDGTLAGSSLTMNDAVRIAVDTCGFDLEAAAMAASTNPARLLGLDDRGRLDAGARADLVALTDRFDVVGTWVGGVRAG